MRSLLADMLVEWEELEGKIDELNGWLTRKVKTCAASGRRPEIPGIGAQTATALVKSGQRFGAQGQAA